MIRRLSIAALAALALGVLATPAVAGSIMMCRSPAPGTAPGPARISMSATGNVYQLDRWGCAAILATDIGEASANGLSQLGSLRAMILSGATAAAQVGQLPPAGYIVGIIVQNQSANAPLGGLKFGTTAGGTDIVTGMNAPAFNAVTSATDASIAKRAFQATQSQAVFVDANGSWNSSQVIITVLFSFF